MDDLQILFEAPLEAFVGFFHSDEKLYLNLAKKILLLSYVEDLFSRIILDLDSGVHKAILSYNKDSDEFDIDFDTHLSDFDEVSFIVGKSKVISYDEYVSSLKDGVMVYNEDIKSSDVLKNIYLFKSFWMDTNNQLIDHKVYPFKMENNYLVEAQAILFFFNKNVGFFKDLYNVGFTNDRFKMLVECKQGDNGCDFDYLDIQYNHYRESANCQPIYKNISSYKEKALLNCYHIIEGEQLRKSKSPKL